MIPTAESLPRILLLPLLPSLQLYPNSLLQTLTSQASRTL